MHFVIFMWRNIQISSPVRRGHWEAHETRRIISCIRRFSRFIAFKWFNSSPFLFLIFQFQFFFIQNIYITNSGAPSLGICGGASDEFISPSNCLQQKTTHSVTIPTSNVIGSASNMRHYVAIIWLILTNEKH